MDVKKRPCLVIDNDVIKELEVDNNHRLLVKVADLPLIVDANAVINLDHSVDELKKIKKLVDDQLGEKDFFENNPQENEYHPGLSNVPPVSFVFMAEKLVDCASIAELEELMRMVKARHTVKSECMNGVCSIKPKKKLKKVVKEKKRQRKR